METNDLWNIIKRFDHYFYVTDSKATLSIAFNTFTLTIVAIKASEILKFYSNETIISIIICIIFLVCLLSLLSLFFTFKSINPFLKSPKKTDEYQSHIYFNHIAEFNNEASFYDSCNKLNNCNINKDLSYQVFVLANGLSKKYRNITISYGILIYFTIPLLTISIILFGLDKVVLKD
jgi:hypothetical protein